MAKSQQSFEKKEKEKKRLKKREDKKAKKEERRALKEESGSGDMIAYIDEYGNIVDTPPDPAKKTKIDASSISLNVPKREKIELSAVRNGTVEFFNDSKGYGFIRELETNESYFVHINGCIDEIQEGNRVTFELERGQKGMNAVKVKKV